jgi:predicted Zn-dependent peptidase
MKQSVNKRFQFSILNFQLLIVFLMGGCALNAQTLDRSIRPSPAPAKEINIKDAQIFTLDNGLKVFLVEDKTTPIVYYSLVLDVQPALQGEKAGMYDMFNSVFGKATTSKTKEQLNRDIDLIGAVANAHRNGVYISFLKKYEQKALDIFSDILLHPVFIQEEFDLTLNRRRTSLSSLGDDGGQITQRVSNALTYGKSYPGGELSTLQSIENVTLDDLINYYETYFAPNVSRLVIVGDVSLAEAQASVKQWLGQWQKKDVPKAEYLIPAAPDVTQVAYIVKPGAVQTSIDVSYPVPFLVGSPDNEAAHTMNDILGGGSTSHLFLNLRETHSYTYGVYSNLDAGEFTGRVSIDSGRGAASVKAAVTDSALHEIMHEFKRIIAEPVSEPELKAAKTYRAGSFSRSLESSGTIAQFAINIDKYNLPKDYYKNYLKRLDAVTVADVQEAAKKYIQPDNAWIVVTGDPTFADRLLPLAGDQTIHYYDYDANPVVDPSIRK